MEIIESLTQIKNFRNFELNKIFCKISTEFEIFRKFDYIRNFSKIWLYSKFLEILKKVDIFWKYWPKSNVLENLT